MKGRLETARAHLKKRDIKCFLLYGPDDGLVRERLTLLTRDVLGDAPSPFALTTLEEADLREDEGRLERDILNLTFCPHHVIKVRATDHEAACLSSVLGLPSSHTTLLVQGGNLSPRSKLRRLFETSKEALTVPCYKDDTTSLNHLLQKTLERKKLTITPEARSLLLGALGEDRGISVQVLERLCLYILPKKTIEWADVDTVVMDSTAFSLDDIAYAVAGGQCIALDKALTRFIASGTSPLLLIRSTAHHLIRLHSVHTLVEAGTSWSEAMGSLSPPVFFKFSERFKKQVKPWTLARTTQAVGLLMQAEEDYKVSSSLSWRTTLYALARKSKISLQEMKG